MDALARKKTKAINNGIGHYLSYLIYGDENCLEEAKTNFELAWFLQNIYFQKRLQ